MSFDYEVLIVGGGPAGLTAGLTLGRLSRSALICDDANPRNKPSQHVNNLPGSDGIPPAQWRENTRKDLQKYSSIQYFEGSVLDIQKTDQGFSSRLSNGKTVSVKKIILAYGIKDQLMSIPGFQELWGQGIYHCPFCHGFEIRGSKLGLIFKNKFALHSLPMIHSLASDLIVFTDGGNDLTADQMTALKSKNITIIENKISALDHQGLKLNGVKLDNGQTVERDYLFYAAEFPFALKSPLGETLGCALNEFGLYQVNDFGATTVPGVYACGDNMQMMQSVLLACASGVKAGAAVISELLS